MGQVTVSIGGRNYALACRDGEEDHLTELASMIEGKIGGLTASVGTMSEPRLLLMAGILIADELFESRKRAAAASSGCSLGAVEDERVMAVAERLEALADSLEDDLADAA